MSDANLPSEPQGPGIALTFLYYFAGTSLVGALLANQLLRVGFETGIPNQLGTVLGLVGGLVGTYFNRTRTLQRSIRGKKAFLNQLNPVLSDLGYTLVEEAAEAAELQLTYRRDGLSALLSGSVYVALSNQVATITSRAVHIRSLEKRLP
ncbi:MAG: hypothetical protein F6J97_01515 [Leptolyngbya sp. SIO4C1]|nr:hypothetical protein [Leptolyngbya sp. SIO4C1]